MLLNRHKLVILKISSEAHVFDLPNRVFHWNLVLFIFIGYLSGEEDNSLFTHSSNAVLGFVTLCMLWRVISTRYAGCIALMHHYARSGESCCRA